MENSTLFTLTPHKKCIAQSNFDPYLNSIKLNPGEYSIKYVSGAILSQGYKYFNQYLPATEQADGDHFNWNKYYISDKTKFGDYDISYFPDNQLKLCCFQCQFGTLPGFTETGYRTKMLTDAFNGTLLNNKNNSYIFTDELSFTVENPMTLIFWYTDLYEQTVYGDITYEITTKESLSDYYLNDISLIKTNLNNDLLSFENYAYKIKTKDIFTENKDTQSVWLNKLSKISYIKDISHFNTIEYNELSSMVPMDTINFNRLYSKDYYWELVEYITPPINLIGRYNYKSPDLLLFEGTYTLIPANDAYLDWVDSSRPESHVHIDNIYGLTEYTFSIDRDYKILDFKFLPQTNNSDVYLYAGLTTREDLIAYFNNINDSYKDFHVHMDNYLDYIEEKMSQEYEINNLNEYQYEYYINVQNVEEGYILVKQADQINSEYEIGPFDTLKTAYEISYKYISDYFNIKNARCYIKTLTDGINGSYIIILNNGPTKINQI